MYVVPFIYRIYISYVSYQSVPLGCLRIFSCDDAGKCWSSAAVHTGYTLVEVEKERAGPTYLLCHIHAVKGVAEVATGQLGGGAMMQTLLLAAHATKERKTEKEGERVK